MITEGYQWDIRKGEIVYGVVAGTVWVVYVAAAVFGEVWKYVGTDVPAGEVVPVATGKTTRAHVVGEGKDVEGQKAQSPSDSDSEGLARSESGAYRTYYAEMDEKPFRGRPSVLSEKSGDGMV